MWKYFFSNKYFLQLIVIFRNEIIDHMACKSHLWEWGHWRPRLYTIWCRILISAAESISAFIGAFIVTTASVILIIKQQYIISWYSLNHRYMLGWFMFLSQFELCIMKMFQWIQRTGAPYCIRVNNLPQNLPFVVQFASVGSWNAAIKIHLTYLGSYGKKRTIKHGKSRVFIFLGRITCFGRKSPRMWCWICHLLTVN